MPLRGADWIINTSPVRVLGDSSGPHSTAIIVGKNTILACAHSLEIVRLKEGENKYKYTEDYWIQPDFTKNRKGEITDEGRVNIKLFKFHNENDWALFIRGDKFSFEDSEIATIDSSPIDKCDRVLAHMYAIVLHCPVALQFGIQKVELGAKFPLHILPATPLITLSMQKAISLLDLQEVQYTCTLAFLF